MSDGRHLPTMPSRRTLLAGLASLGTAATAGCLGVDAVAAGTDADTDWPMPDYDRFASAYAYDAAAPRESPDERFRVETPSPTDRPVVADGVVYLPTMGGLLALDARTGEERWRYTTQDRGAHWFSSPAVSGDAVYVTGEPPALVALDPADGEVQWSIGDDRLARAPPAPAAEWHRLFVGDEEGTVHAVTTDGEVDWTVDVFGSVTRLVANGHEGVYAGTSAGTVYALYDGRGLWRRSVPGKVTALAADNGNDVFVGTFGGGVQRLAGGAHAGRPRWHAEEGPTAHRSLVTTRNAVFGADGAGLSRLDDGTGNRDWRLGDDYFAAPAAAGDTVYVAGAGEVAAFSLGGGVGLGGSRVAPRRWTHDLGDAGGGSVAVADGALFVPIRGGEDGTPGLLALE